VKLTRTLDEGELVVRDGERLTHRWCWLGYLPRLTLIKAASSYSGFINMSGRQNDLQVQLNRHGFGSIEGQHNKAR
jgi:hypothetical protein